MTRRALIALYLFLLWVNATWMFVAANQHRLADWIWQFTLTAFTGWILLDRWHTDPKGPK